MSDRSNTTSDVDRSENPVPRGGRLGAYARRDFGRRGNYLLGGLALAVAMGLGAYALLLLRPGVAVPDIGPCDMETAGLAVFLFDFTKPLADGAGVDAGAVLRESALALPASTELRVYTLSGQPAVPLAEVGRLCKPAGGTPGDRLDCSALPAAHGAAFCARLGDMQRQVAELAREAPELPVPSAHLVEAIEDARLLFAGRPGASHRSLLVFSDMIQHAAWYSHLTPDGSLRLDPFDDLRAQLGSGVGVAPPGAGGVAAEVFYIRRRGLTEPTDRREAHQALWQRYFASAGMPVVFIDTPAMPRYLAAPPADPTSLTPVLRQRELLQREQAESVRIQALVELRSAELDQARRDAAVGDRLSEALAESLLAEEAEERRGIATERAEIASLTAELEARRAVDDSAD